MFLVLLIHVGHIKSWKKNGVLFFSYNGNAIIQLSLFIILAVLYTRQRFSEAMGQIVQQDDASSLNIVWILIPAWISNHWCVGATAEV